MPVIQNQQAIEQAVKQILFAVGEDPNREGLIETPHRVYNAYMELLSGYTIDVDATMKTFCECGNYDGIVLLADIEFDSLCEHHMLPFSGVAHVAYIPNKKNKQVIGVSKLARVLDIFTKRLQIQERIGQQVTQALMQCLEPTGAACIIRAQHLCMKCRGVKKQNSKMITSSLTGAFKDDPATRNELFELIQM